MYVVMGVHHPKLGMEKPLLEVQESSVWLSEDTAGSYQHSSGRTIKPT
jgi:hypothetical protein